MSNISHKRLMEMEAEMDRFEQEILTQPLASDLPRVVIGPNTYNQVSAQLKLLRAQSGLSAEEKAKKQLEVASQLKALRAASEFQNLKEMKEESDEDEDDDGEEDEGDKYSFVGRNEPPPKKPMLDPSLSMLPPPPPPPVIGGPTPSSGSSATPSFMPPQLRRAPPPPPSSRPPGPPMSGPPGGHPMGGPPRMRPPPPPPHARGPYPGHGPMGPMGGPPGGPGGYPPGPNPNMGPMGGPGPGPHMGPMRMGGPPGPPMGGPPRPPGFMPGPRSMGPPGGPHSMDPGSGPGMYGVSSGDKYPQEETPKEKVVEEKPKVIYASAPVINVQKEKKEKKKKKKKKEEGESDAAGSEKKAEAHTDVIAGPSLPTRTNPTASSVVSLEEPNDNLQIADMDIDGVQMTRKEKKEKKKKFVRMAAGKTWEDQSLQEWDQDDFRLFCGDLGNEVTDEVLARAFNKYSSFVRAKVVRDKRSNKTKGYGFVSFRDPNDYVRAMREMNGKYVGNRPIKLRKSTWKDRNIDIVKRKEKEKKRLGLK